MLGHVGVELPQEWAEIERRFPGCSAAFDRDLGERWLSGRDGPRFDICGVVLKAFAGESDEHDHRGPWAAARYDVAQECWIVTRDNRR
jgi:hypothetical protein